MPPRSSEEEQTPGGDSGYSGSYPRPASLRSDYGDLKRATSPVPAYRVESPVYQHAVCHTPPTADYRLSEESVYPLLHHSSSSPALSIYHPHHHHHHSTNNTATFVSASPGEDGFQPSGDSGSPPHSLFRLTCSPVHLGPPQQISGHAATTNTAADDDDTSEGAAPQFTALVGASSTVSPDKGCGADLSSTTGGAPAAATATFRLSDLAESGYRLDLQSGQLQIHLDLSTGDVLNLSGVVTEAEPGSSPLLEAGESTAYLQPAYYDMSSTVVTAMDDTESAAAHSAYPAYFSSSAAGGGGSLGGSALSANASSSSPYNRYSELCNPSLYSTYYQGGYSSWAGAQPTPGTSTAVLCMSIPCSPYYRGGDPSRV